MSTVELLIAGSNLSLTQWQGLAGVAYTQCQAGSVVSIGDGVSPSTLKVTVAQFHNADNQNPGSTAYGLLTGGVAQLLNVGGFIDRQRETGFDGVTAVGIASGTQQLASPINGLILTQNITANVNAQTVNVSAISVTSRGQVLSLAVGSAVLVDTGANQEQVIITAVPSSTSITAVFTKNHTSGAALVSFAYNQARDATIADGTSGTGISANGTFLLNLNGGWEAERSAAGELDGASGVGTAVAAEYEFNGGGPHGSYDRARSIQGKLLTSLATSAAAGGKSITLSSAAPAGLLVGMSVQLTGGTTETVEIASVSGTAVTVTTNIVNAGHTALAFESFSSTGPGLTGFSPLGMGIEEEAVYDPVTNLFYLERSATADAMAPQNVVVENAGRFNGTTIDRERGNVDLTLVTLTAATASGNSGDQTNYNGRGIQVGVNITAITGTTPSLVVTIQGKDVASGVYYTLLQSAALTATGFTLLTVNPGGLTTANVASPQVLPRTFRILYTIAGTTPSVTATIGGSVVV